jgi:HSF-type DNA-binding
MTSRKNSHHGPTSFIKKTYKILNEGKFQNIISWNDDGNSFIIKDLESFTNSVLPSYFKHKNFASFVRQLNMYDFHKLKENSLEFVHPLFQRNNISLLKEIHRKNIENPSSKSNNITVSDRIEKFLSQQNQLQDLLNKLERDYDIISEQNQILIQELIRSKQREKNIEKMLGNFKGSYQIIPFRPENSDEDYENAEYYEKLSPL